MDVAAKDATDSAETVDVVDVTADADAATTDVASAITAACGSSFFSVAAAVSATAVDAAMVADAAADADVDAKPSFVYLAIPGTEFLLRPFFCPHNYHTVSLHSYISTFF